MQCHQNARLSIYNLIFYIFLPPTLFIQPPLLFKHFYSHLSNLQYSQQLISLFFFYFHIFLNISLSHSFFQINTSNIILQISYYNISLIKPDPMPPLICFILLLLFSPAFSWYSLKTSSSFYGYSVTSFALAPKDVNAISSNINLAIGLMNGTVIFTYTDNFNTKYNAYPFQNNIPILKMDWTEAGVFLQTAYQIKVIDPINYSTKLYMNFSELISTSASAYSVNGSKIMTAVSFQNRI